MCKLTPPKTLGEQVQNISELKFITQYRVIGTKGAGKNKEVIDIEEGFTNLDEVINEIVPYWQEQYPDYTIGYKKIEDY